MGLVLAWLAGVDWSNMPTRVIMWIRLQRRRLGLRYWVASSPAFSGYSEIAAHNLENQSPVRSLITLK